MGIGAPYAATMMGTSDATTGLGGGGPGGGLYSAATEGCGVVGVAVCVDGVHPTAATPVANAKSAARLSRCAGIAPSGAATSAIARAQKGHAASPKRT